MRGKSLDEVRKIGFKQLGTTLRVQIADHIKRHPDKYQRYFAPDWKDCPEKDDGPSPRSWEEWLGTLTRPKRWICHLSLRAGAKRLGALVVIWSKLQKGISYCAWI